LRLTYTAKRKVSESSQRAHGEAGALQERTAIRMIARFISWHGIQVLPIPMTFRLLDQHGRLPYSLIGSGIC
jgi:hypothetical protein